MLTDQQHRQLERIVSKPGAILGGILWASLFWLALIITP